MNKRSRSLGTVFLGAFIILIINLTYLQVFAANKISSHPGNKRALAKEASIERGKILSADNRILADNRIGENIYVRTYPEGETASAIIGFNSIKYGRAGIELTYNDYLLGKREVTSIEDYIKGIAGEKIPGNDIILTINYSLQKEAFEALGNNRGAIVALEPKTGAVLAMATTPAFNPNTLDEDWETLINDSSAPLINRAIQGLYPPGSSFKIITASAAIDSGTTAFDSIYKSPGEIEVHGNIVSNYKKEDLGEIPLDKAFALSANTAFAQIGLDLGADKLVKYAEGFGLNHQIPFNLPVKTSSIPAPKKMDDVDVAWGAIGQADVLVTPLQMALVGSSIANEGTVMKPFLVKEIRDHRGIIVKSFEGKKWLKPIEQTTAKEIAEMMIKTVEEGTGEAAQISNISVAGKTGTAEVANSDPHAWFIGFAPAQNPKIVVAVIVENGGLGSKGAAPLAKRVIQKALTLTK